MNIKHIEKNFEKKLMPYMRKGDNENYVSHFILMLVFDLYGFEFISYNKILLVLTKLKTKFK
jgi:hypothetical protein